MAPMAQTEKVEVPMKSYSLFDRLLPLVYRYAGFRPVTIHEARWLSLCGLPTLSTQRGCSSPVIMLLQSI